MARSRLAPPSRALVAALALAVTALLVPTAAVAAGIPQQAGAGLVVDAPGCFATVTSHPPDGDGRVLSARDPERLTVGADEIVDIDPGELSLEPGDRLEIFRLLGPVQRPEGGVLGEAVLVVGGLEITDMSGERVVGRIVDPCNEVQIGDLLRRPVPRDVLESVTLQGFDPGRALEPRGGDAVVVFGHVETVPDEVGDLGTTRWAQLTYGPGDVVTIDQGSVDGWEPGTVALVYQHGPVPGDPPSYGEESVALLGTAVAISTMPDTTVLLITDGDRAVRVGSRVRRLDEN